MEVVMAQDLSSGVEYTSSEPQHPPLPPMLAVRNGTTSLALMLSDLRLQVDRVQARIRQRRATWKIAGENGCDP